LASIYGDDVRKKTPIYEEAVETPAKIEPPKKKNGWRKVGGGLKKVAGFVGKEAIVGGRFLGHEAKLGFQKSFSKKRAKRVGVKHKRRRYRAKSRVVYRTKYVYKPKARGRHKVHRAGHKRKSFVGTTWGFTKRMWKL